MYTAGYAQHEHPEAATFGVGEHHKYLIRQKSWGPLRVSMERPILQACRQLDCALKDHSTCVR